MEPPSRALLAALLEESALAAPLLDALAHLDARLLDDARARQEVAALCALCVEERRAVHSLRDATQALHHELAHASDALEQVRERVAELEYQQHQGAHPQTHSRALFPLDGEQQRRWSSVERDLETEPLARLNLSSRRLTDSDMMWLSQHPSLSQVKRLDLRWNSFGARGVAALVNSPHVWNLRRLHLDYNRLGHDGVAHIANARNLGALRRLSLRKVKLNRQGLEALASSTTLRSLKRLELGDYYCVAENSLTTSRTLPPWLKVKSWRQVATLRSGVQRLDDWVEQPGHVLVLDEEAAQPHHIARLAAHPHRELLQMLVLSRCGLGAEQLVELVPQLRQLALQRLDLSHNDLSAIEPEALSALCEVAGVLDLSSCALERSHISALLQHRAEVSVRVTGNPGVLTRATRAMGVWW